VTHSNLGSCRSFHHCLSSEIVRESDGRVVVLWQPRNLERAAGPPLCLSSNGDLTVQRGELDRDWASRLARVEVRQLVVVLDLPVDRMSRFGVARFAGEGHGSAAHTLGGRVIKRQFGIV
jgi:hypothetical protein